MSCVSMLSHVSCASMLSHVSGWVNVESCVRCINVSVYQPNIHLRHDTSMCRATTHRHIYVSCHQKANLYHDTFISLTHGRRAAGGRVPWLSCHTKIRSVLATPTQFSPHTHTKFPPHTHTKFPLTHIRIDVWTPITNGCKCWAIWIDRGDMHMQT